MSIWVREDALARVENRENAEITYYTLYGGQDAVYVTGRTEPADIYRSALKEFGRCVSKVYVEKLKNEQSDRHIGWVFEREDHYEDTGEPFIRETWITLLDGPPNARVYWTYRDAS